MADAVGQDRQPTISISETRMPAAMLATTRPYLVTGATGAARL